MRVIKAQAQVQANRAHIVETAFKPFREYGYDGGVADLMEAAGFTQGRIYNHLRSKADLMAEATVREMSQIEAKDGNRPLPSFSAVTSPKIIVLLAALAAP